MTTASTSRKFRQPRGEMRWLLDADDAGVLDPAAILHDVGFWPSIALTGFHALDGARYLRSVSYDERVTDLVAHHSCAAVEPVEQRSGLHEARPAGTRHRFASSSLPRDSRLSCWGRPGCCRNPLGSRLGRGQDCGAKGTGVHRCPAQIHQVRARGHHVEAGQGGGGQFFGDASWRAGSPCQRGRTPRGSADARRPVALEDRPGYEGPLADTNGTKGRYGPANSIRPPECTCHSLRARLRKCGQTWRLVS
jgi:hypothetical protein